MEEKTTIHALPPELIAAIFTHLKKPSTLYWPTIEPGISVKWPAHHIEHFKHFSEKTLDPVDEIPPVNIVFTLSSVCRHWKNISSVVFEEYERFLPKDTHGAPHRGFPRAPLYAIHVVGDPCENKSVLGLSIDIVKHGDTLRFVHISSHAFFYTALPENRSDWHYNSKDSWKNANYNVAQWVLNTCPNLIHLEISLANLGALNWWALGDFPAKTSLDTLHHANLESLCVLTPLRVDPNEHALVEQERAVAPYTIDDKHYIDPNFFSSFDTSGLPRLKSIIVMQHIYGFRSEESDRKMWFETLREKGLALGMSCIEEEAVSAQRVVWLDGTETNDEIDDIPHWYSDSDYD